MPRDRLAEEIDGIVSEQLAAWKRDPFMTPLMALKAIGRHRQAHDFVHADWCDVRRFARAAYIEIVGLSVSSARRIGGVSPHPGFGQNQEHQKRTSGDRLDRGARGTVDRQGISG